MSLNKNFARKVAVSLRSHWKKSTFAALALTYAASVAREHVLKQRVMREYCAKASVYGNAPLPPGAQPRTITVILNPNANRRKALKQFEKYCAPILHLSGMFVDVLQTESEGHAKTLAKKLTKTDAVVVAGGDGTLSEVVTGLVRHSHENADRIMPIGILPLGRSNTLANRFFPSANNVEHVRSLAEASLAIVQGYLKPVDVMKIEVLDKEKNGRGRPVYALSGIEWGALRDARSKKDSYWYFGPLRNYVTYVFNGFKSSLCWNCEAVVSYSPPCSGCSNCVKSLPVVENRKWYQRFLPHSYGKPAFDYSLIENEHCREIQVKTVSTSDFILRSNVPKKSESQPAKLDLVVGPKKLGYLDFIIKGWQMENGNSRKAKKVLEARQIEIVPMGLHKKNHTMFSIDNEDYEVKPVRVTVLPKLVQIYVKHRTQKKKKR